MTECNSIDSTECNSIETSNLNNQQFRINKINEIKNYFNAQIKERELMSKRLSKYIASFDQFDKTLIVLSARSLEHFYCIIALFGTPVGIASASLSLTFSLSTGLVKKIIKNNKEYKKT